MSLLNCMAGGVIMGVLLFHLIPEMVVNSPHLHDQASRHGGHHHHDHDGHECCSRPGGLETAGDGSRREEAAFCLGDYEWGALAAGLSFFLLLGTDRLFLTHYNCRNKDGSSGENKEHRHAHHPHGLVETLKAGAASLSRDEGSRTETRKEDGEDHSSCHSADVVGGCHVEGISEASTKMQSFIFVMVLSLHSFLEGLAINSIGQKTRLMIFMFGFLFHKCLEAFALGINVFKANFAGLHSISLNVFYALLTPLGIVMGLAIPNSHANGILCCVLNGLAVGSFLFVACIEMIVPEFHKADRLISYKFGCTLVGFLLMAAVSIIPDSHTH